MSIDPADIAICVTDDEEATSTGSRPTSPPIVQTSTFTFPTFGDLVDGLSVEHRNNVYTRGRNPTVEVVERKLARLERGEECKCFGSGMAAISAVMLGLLKAGDHILFVNHTYGPTLQFAEHLRRFDIEHDLLLDLDPEAVGRALRPNTRLLWLESPGTMTMRVLDIAAISSLARERGVLTCIDNSWATPLYQKPLTMGVDIVVHTASKYLSGHSDVIAGAVISTSERMEKIFYRSFLLNGGILGPVDAWLLLRGLRTLPVRLQQHGTDAARVAEFLHDHPAVGSVHYPLFDPDADLVARQLTGLTGLLSFELVRADFESVARFIDGLEIPRIGVSWGGVESLVTSPERLDNGEQLASRGIPRGLVRLSVGLEGAGALIDDLDSALSAVS
jgi:cystathionine beta-lyase/cystathionine gamma-synthase